MDESAECVRRIQFCSGHRVHRHESKCAHPHGHNYVAFIHARAPELDSIGRVIDFSVLKQKVGGWIDENWDHGFIFYAGDAPMCRFFELNADGKDFKSYMMPSNPTAENMAKHLVEEVCPTLMLGTGVEVFKVVLWETENCHAIYRK